MAADLTVTDCTLRLADQLRALSEVTETLTFRLLELEERLLIQEHQAQDLIDGPQVAEATEFRMAETEGRLSRLETVLRGVAASSPARQLRPVQAADQIEQESFLVDDFQDEPFLDELSA